MSDSSIAKEEEEGKDQVEAENLANKSGKICFVCGDKALGFNFGTMSCESCKAFFRRNATKNKAFTCPFENNCNIDNITRRFCQKCRLQKCFDVGMKKEYILSEEERKQKRQKIEENRVKKIVKRQLSPFSSVTLPGKKPQARVSPSTRTGEANFIPDSKNKFAQESRQTENVSELCLPNTDSQTFLPATPDGLLKDVPGPHLVMAAPGSLDILPGSSQATPNAQHLAVFSYPSTLNETNSRVASNKQQTIIGEKQASSLQQRLHGIQQGANIVTTSQYVPVHVREGVTQGLAAAGSSSHCTTITCTCVERECHLSTGSPDDLESLSSDLVTPVCPDKQETSRPIDTQAIDYSLDHSNLDSVVEVAIKAEFHAVTLSHNCSGGAPALNEREQARLHELFIASRSLLEPVDRDEEPSMAHFTSEPCLISVINLTDLAIKRIIKMAKQIAPFKHLCQEDQVALLKGGCTELMILRSVMNYNPEKNSWSIPSNASRELSMDVLKEASHLGVNLYEEHKKFVSSFDPRWRSDENIMLLLSAIALFSPDRANVTHRDVIKLEQDSYYYLLRRYLETGVETGCEARRIYLHLIGKLLELHRLNESHIQLFMEVNPRQVEPLLIEIFDLNSHQRKPSRFN